MLAQTPNILQRKKRGYLQAAEQYLADAGRVIPRWKISDIFNGKRLDDPDAESVLTALAAVVAARELAAKQNLQKAEDAYQSYLHILSPK